MEKVDWELLNTNHRKDIFVKMQRTMKNVIQVKGLFIMLTCLIVFMCMGVDVHAQENTTYQIWVNRAANCVTVYTKDATGNYTIPVRSFACSCGKEGRETPLGVFTTSNYYNWRRMVDGTYAQYAIRFNGKILFHSVPYYSQNSSNLEKDQFNMLGEDASLGCVRLAVSDVKWLYDNCPKGTVVVVYDDETNPGPLGKPQQMKMDLAHPFAGWDPTDVSEINPWNTVKPSLYLVNDMGDGVLYVPVGATLEAAKAAVGLKNSVGAAYPAGTYSIEFNGSYNLNVPGVYKIWVSGYDALGVKTEQEMMLAVIG